MADIDELLADLNVDNPSDPLSEITEDCVRHSDLLTELGWTKRDLAERLHIHENTVYSWEEAPGYAMVYLRLMAGLKRLLE